MANLTKIYSGLDPIDFNFDSNLIEFVLGQNPKLKELASFTDLGLYLPLSTDSSNIAPVSHSYIANNLTYTTGVVAGSAIFDSSANTYILFNDDLHSGGATLEMGFSFYAKQNTSAVQIAFSYSRNNRFFNFTFENQNTLKFKTTTQTLSYSVDLSVYHRFHFNVRQNGDTDIFVDYVKVATLASTSLTYASPENTILGIGRNGGTGKFDGNIEQFTVLKNRVYTDAEILREYNEGVNRREPQYSPDYPTIRQNTPSSNAQLVSWGGYSLTNNGDGSTGIRLSKDDYTTTEYWGSGVSLWINSGSSYNAVATVNTNIPDFSAVEQQISTEIALISDGFQQVELLVEQINYALNTAPTINAGLDKPLGGASAITIIDNFKPSSDGSATDVDNSVVTLEISAAGAPFENIPQGVYASLNEALNNKTYNASTFGPGTIDFIIRATDSLGATSQDTVQVTIINDNTATIEDTNTKVTSILSALNTVDSNVALILIDTNKIYANQIADEETSSTGVSTWKNSAGTTLETFDLEDGVLFSTAKAIVKKTRRS